MICQQCGRTLNPGATFCGECGAPIQSRATQTAETSSPVSIRLQAVSLIAWKVLKATVLNPVEGLPAVFQSLSTSETLETGAILAGIFDLCAFIGLYLMLPQWAGQPGFGDILKLLLLGAVPPAAITGASILTRKVFQSPAGTIESDVFIAGVSLIPSALTLLVAGMLGIGNFEVIALVSVFALSYTVLILYTGCTKISAMAAVRAVPAVPVIVVIAGWLSKKCLRNDVLK